ncbi:hypothetical protein AVEN_271166-1, partial [Araneus ventricosus]
PFNLKTFWKLWNELDSPNWVTFTPAPAITFPLDARKWAVRGKENWSPCLSYLRSYLRTSPPLNRFIPTFVDVKAKFLDRPRPPRSM